MCNLETFATFLPLLHTHKHAHDKHTLRSLLVSLVGVCFSLGCLSVCLPLCVWLSVCLCACGWLFLALCWTLSAGLSLPLSVKEASDSIVLPPTHTHAQANTSCGTDTGTSPSTNECGAQKTRCHPRRHTTRRKGLGRREEDTQHCMVLLEDTHTHTATTYVFRSKTTRRSEEALAA